MKTLMLLPEQLRAYPPTARLSPDSRLSGGRACAAGPRPLGACPAKHSAISMGLGAPLPPRASTGRLAGRRAARRYRRDQLISSPFRLHDAVVFLHR